MINALGMVNKALLGSEKDIFEPLKKIRPDIITLGYDQHFETINLEKEITKRGISSKVVRIPFSKECTLCSTGAIIKEILKRYGSTYPSTVCIFKHKQLYRFLSKKIIYYMFFIKIFFRAFRSFPNPINRCCIGNSNKILT